jgi:hypothetical protein
MHAFCSTLGKGSHGRAAQVVVAVRALITEAMHISLSDPLDPRIVKYSPNGTRSEG